MLLAVDIGNTNITLGVFEDNKLVETFRLASDKDLSEQESTILFLEYFVLIYRFFFFCNFCAQGH